MNADEVLKEMRGCPREGNGRAVILYQDLRIWADAIEAELEEARTQRAEARLLAGENRGLMAEIVALREKVGKVVEEMESPPKRSISGLSLLKRKARGRT